MSDCMQNRHGCEQAAESTSLNPPIQLHTTAHYCDILMQLIFRKTLAVGLLSALGACATISPPPEAAAPMPTGWQAPLPHGGSVEDLARWWARVDDPLLVDLIESAQAVSPGMAQARSRIAQARATQVASRSALGPSLDGQASASRGFNEQVRSTATTAQAGL